MLYEDELGCGINGQPFLTSGAGMCEWRALLSWQKQGYSIVRSPAEFCNWSRVAAPVDSLLAYPATLIDSLIHDGEKRNICLCFAAVICRKPSKTK